MISNVISNSVMNTITCDVDGDQYELAFDTSGTLCELSINNVGNCDWNEVLIGQIIMLADT